MYNELHDYLQRPSLYERTADRFWNDEHISKQMLEAHVDPDTDAASRKPDFIKQCVEWVLSLPLPVGASLLDIGCGPGLYTKQFAQRGLRVTGLDFSESSITYARNHDPGSDYVLQDYLSMDYQSAFDVISLIYYDYGALVPEERRTLLRLVHRALKPGGLFLFDVLTPPAREAKNDHTSWELNSTGGFWTPSPHLCLHATYYYDDVAEVRRTVVIDESTVRSYNIWDCYFTQESLLGEITPMGLSVIGFYGDMRGNPYSDDSPSLCAVLRKREPGV